MKKLFTLMAAALMAVSVNAQTETPLVLGGGWNAGFVGESDVYDFTVSKQWGAAEFACNVNSADYPKYILEFEDPLPTNFQVNYTWKTSAEGDATPAYGRAVGDGTTKKFELSFDQEHPYIVNVSVQHTDEEEVNLKVKKLTLVGADGSEKQVDPAFTGWAGTDNTVSYKGVVSFDGQWQQLAINGLAGKSNVTVKVKLAEPTPNVQMCVDYEKGVDSEWPQFNGSDETTFTTKEDAVIKTMGIQYTDPEKNPVKVSVLGAWLIDTTTGISNIENVKLQDGKCFNLAGQQVAKGYKGIVIKNGKKMVIK